ncbi:hypothetical protein [Actinophytocola sediminis]
MTNHDHGPLSHVRVRDHGTPCQDYPAIEEDPQVRPAELLWTVPLGEREGTLRTPPSPRRGAPRAGQHTEEVLGG